MTGPDGAAGGRLAPAAPGRRWDDTPAAAPARRVLMVVPQPFFRPSGTPLNVLQMCRALGETGYEVHMVTLPMGQDVASPNLVYHRVARVPFLNHVPIGFSFAKAVYDLLLAIELGRLLRRHRFAAVHAIEEAAFFAAPLGRLFGTPVVADLDSDLCSQLGENRSRLVRCLARPAAALRRRALRRSTCALTVARHLTELVGEVSPGTPVFEIGDTPHEAATRAPDPERVEALREELDLGARRAIAYTGNLDRRQGIEVLLRAFPRVLGRFPGAALLLVGGDPGRCALMRRLARSLGIDGAVHLLEPRPPDDMPEIMALADVLVSPRLEPFVTPLKVYTYMASGRPIVATDLPTHTRVLDGRTAILTPPTAEGLADGLARALADPAHGERLAARARRLVERNHSYATFKRRLARVYAFVERQDPGGPWAAAPVRRPMGHQGGGGRAHPSPPPRGTAAMPKPAPAVPRLPAGAAAPTLVTGATGFTGGRLALELVQRGERVRALVRPGSDVRRLRATGVELVAGDIRDAAAVARAAEGARRIYHIAAVFRAAGHPDGFYAEVNVGGTENVLAAARRHGVERTVHCSTIGVHGDVREIPCTEDSPFNPGDVYQRTKLEGERRAQAAFASGLPGCVFRPAGIYGPGDLRFLKLFRTIQGGTFRMFGSGETFWHAVYIDDLVDGIILCGEHPAALGRTYILAGEGYATLNELVRTIAEAVGVRPPRGRLPFWPLLTGAVLCERLCAPLGIDPPLHRRRVEFFVKNRAFSIDRARRELGFQPRVDTAEGMRRTAAWYFETGHLGRPNRVPDRDTSSIAARAAGAAEGCGRARPW